MKILLPIIACLLCASGAFAQSTSYHPVRCDTSVATATWDSVYLGGDFQKVVTVINDTAAVGILMFATENDTTAGKIGFLKIVAPSALESWTFITNARWLRTKALGTARCPRRVISSQALITR